MICDTAVTTPLTTVWIVFHVVIAEAMMAAPCVSQVVWIMPITTSMVIRMAPIALCIVSAMATKTEPNSGIFVATTSAHSTNPQPSSTAQIIVSAKAAIPSITGCMASRMPRKFVAHATPKPATARTIRPIGDNSAPSTVTIVPRIMSTGPAATATRPIVTANAIKDGSTSVNFVANSLNFWISGVIFCTNGVKAVIISVWIPP